MTIAREKVIALVVLRLLGLGCPLLEDGQLHALALGKRHLQIGNTATFQ